MEKNDKRDSSVEKDLVEEVRKEYTKNSKHRAIENKESKLQKHSKS